MRLQLERDVKDGIYEQFARIGMAVASPGRIEVLDLLAQGEKTVERLAAESGREIRNTSAHLRTLRQARLSRPARRADTFTTALRVSV